MYIKTDLKTVKTVQTEVFIYTNIYKYYFLFNHDIPKKSQ